MSHVLPHHANRRRSFEWDLLDLDPSQGAWALTRDLVLSFVGEHASRMLSGQPAADFIDRDMHEIAPEPVIERMSSMFDLVSTTRSRVFGSALWNGRRVRSAFVPSRDRSGGVTEMLIVTRVAPLGEPAVEGVDEADYVGLGSLQGLTARELEVLAYFGQGMRAAEVAQKIHRSVKTIRRFQSELSRKLGVEGRCQLALRARDIGLRPHHAGLARI